MASAMRELIMGVWGKGLGALPPQWGAGAKLRPLKLNVFL